MIRALFDRLLEALGVAAKDTPPPPSTRPGPPGRPGLPGRGGNRPAFPIKPDPTIPDDQTEQ